jgi:molybdenum cofactor guanylyltransferase
MPRARVTAIILAGGRAARFGGPKLGADLDGRPLLDHVLQAVAAVSDEIVVAGELPGGMGAPAGVAVRAVPDQHVFEGPLAALAGALAGIDLGLAIVVGGDMPWLQPAVLEAMLARLEGDSVLDIVTLAAPAIAADEPGRPQTLPLAIRVESVGPAAARAVFAGDRSLVRLLDRLQSIEIPAPEWLPLDPEARTLRDVDRPEDLAQMRREMR